MCKFLYKCRLRSPVILLCLYTLSGFLLISTTIPSLLVLFAKNSAVAKNMNVPAIKRPNTLVKKRDNAPAINRRNATVAKREMSDDLLAMDKPDYLSNYKNPCWYDEKKALKCLPYFQLVGNDKCGTTDLYDRLVHHPQVIKNNGGLGKETYWWAWSRYGHFVKKDDGNFVSIKSYLGNFKNATKVINNTITNGTNYHPLIVGDGSPMTFWDLAGWRRIPQNKNKQKPEVTTGHLIKHLIPKCKIVVMFRNPTARTYTDYHFLGGFGGYSTTAELFHRRVLQAIDMFEDCARVHRAWACAFNWTLTDRLPVRIHISMYSLQLREWLKAYKRKEMFIIRTEDYSADISGTLKNLTKFLEIGDYPSDVLNDISKQEKKHQTQRKKLQTPMLQETKTLLDHYYATYNAELAKILKDDRFLWKD